MLGIRDAYYDDESEWFDAFHRSYRTILRAMRDTGVPGHVLIADRMDEYELASLARQNTFFFAPAPEREDLAVLLEHQKQVAVPRDKLPIVFDLMNEYAVRKIFILDRTRPRSARCSPISMQTRLLRAGIALTGAIPTGRILLQQLFYLT